MERGRIGQLALWLLSLLALHAAPLPLLCGFVQGAGESFATKDFTVTVLSIGGGFSNCKDLPGDSGAVWQDTDGDNCASYAAQSYCGGFGSNTYPEGSANDKCCACGGGTKTVDSSGSEALAAVKIDFCPAADVSKEECASAFGGHCDELAFDKPGSALGWWYGEPGLPPDYEEIPMACTHPATKCGRLLDLVATSAAAQGLDVLGRYQRDTTRTCSKRATYTSEATDPESGEPAYMLWYVADGLRPYWAFGPPNVVCTTQSDYDQVGAEFGDNVHIYDAVQFAERPSSETVQFKSRDQANSATFRVSLPSDLVCVDSDGDGFASVASGGNDCDDTDPALFRDVDNNGKCDGTLPGTPAPTPAPTEDQAPDPTPGPTPPPPPSPPATPSPTGKPTPHPTRGPTAKPTAKPTPPPTHSPTAKPTLAPTAKPTAEPTAQPTVNPTVDPTGDPTSAATRPPTPPPSPSPTPAVTASPTPAATASPTPAVTASPTPAVTASPTPSATTPATTPPPTPEATTTPSSPPVDECTDSPSGWSDSDSDNCAKYESHLWCNRDGSYGANWVPGDTYENYAVNGVTASQACCACGGGSSSGGGGGDATTTEPTPVVTRSPATAPPTPPPTPPPTTPATTPPPTPEATAIPSLPPVDECTDSPSGWSDSDSDNCAKYESHLWCNRDGSYGANWVPGDTYENYAVNGVTASQACCACGGGSSSGGGGGGAVVSSTPEPATAECTVGDQIEGNWRGRGRWSTGTITRVTSNRIVIKWDNGIRSGRWLRYSRARKNGILCSTLRP